MIHVHVLCERFAGELRCSSYIRLLLPLTHATNVSHIRMTCGRTYKKADIVIAERTWEQDLAAAEELVKNVRRDDGCLVYTIDDDLLALTTDGVPQNSFMTQPKIRLVELLVRESHGVLVTTDRLKQKMLFYNNRVLTIPNAIDERLFNSGTAPVPQNGNERPLVMGYMGTSTHDAAILMIADALRRSLRKHRRALTFELIGGVGNRATLEAFAGLPMNVLRSGDSMKYPAFIRWMAQTVRWDFAIAPLEDNAFTRGKSDIKFLDYSALGIPGIYSRVPAYLGSVSHRETGLLVDNHADAWEDAVDFMVSRHEVRAEIARNARSYVWTRRTLTQNAAHWREALFAILAARQGAEGRRLLGKGTQHQRSRFFERVRQAICAGVPADSTMLIAGRISDELRDVGGRRAQQFPRDGWMFDPERIGERGRLAVAHLEELRHLGAEFLVVPATAFWWLDRVLELKQHLESRYRTAVDENTCKIFALRLVSRRPSEQSPAPLIVPRVDNASGNAIAESATTLG